jgi:hypothetical protein
MVAGGGIGGLVMAALPLIGIVTILRARARRKTGREAPDQESVDRRTATIEAERRMASYLASRDSRNWRDDGE